ncbi:hypothetical protein RGU41_09075 [Cryobacterium sp. 10C3]|nr:hypothetical protein [Cryobacterium sp. 10C3]MDY7556887.1 hypothetical protein [Cryobacterium sp. 10C3]
MVTTSDAFHGENFRRGGFLDPKDRYVRAEEFVAVARALWDGWAPGALAANKDTGSSSPPMRSRRSTTTASSST